MNRRRKRTVPTVTELARIESVLEADHAIRQHLEPKTSPVRRRDGQMVHFAAETLAVASSLMTRRLNPERAKVRKVLAVAADVLRIVGTEDSDEEPGSRSAGPTAICHFSRAWRASIPKHRPRRRSLTRWRLIRCTGRKRASRHEKVAMSKPARSTRLAN